MGIITFNGLATLIQVYLGPLRFGLGSGEESSPGLIDIWCCIVAASPMFIGPLALGFCGMLPGNARNRIPKASKIEVCTHVFAILIQHTMRSIAN